MKNNNSLDFPFLAFKAYKNGKLAALDAIITAWGDKLANLSKGTLYSEVLHMRHIYRGLIALDNNDVATAKTELIKSSMVSRSFMMYFGPNMLLAHRLLKYGERRTVIKFLKNCRKFWPLPIRLYFARTWIASIRRGETPDFGDHLHFHMSWRSEEEFPALMTQ